MVLALVRNEIKVRFHFTRSRVYGIDRISLFARTSYQAALLELPAVGANSCSLAFITPLLVGTSWRSNSADCTNGFAWNQRCTTLSQSRFTIARNAIP